ncbi:cytochrome P450 [Streptomyces ureilyticus]|uniref:Cytochrome P450 n=1 Tax=Streptomyces ureilyticus TaxID=1775131 RepID=A0ABX0DJP2_9ACTN|nr:cytochrome P450 [Streptomyces ureilyticus]NGO40629.1 cytochrome P450 [Streptomyces ureilyticus]
MTTLTTHPDPFYLDPNATDVHGDARRLNARGPLVPALLDVGLRVWATGNRDVAEAILGDRDSFRKDPEHWADLKDGKVPGDWGIREFITLPGMLNADGARHRTLRGLVSAAFTARRVEKLRPRIDEIVQALIADLAKAAPGGFVELRRSFAFELPMQIICHLFGLDPSSGETLTRNYTAMHASSSTAEEAIAGKQGVVDTITALIDAKRRTPADDLTSALIAATDGEDATLDDELLTYTLMLFLFAGQSTTQDLIVNCLKALADHPTQQARVRAGAVPIEDVVEEVLRWNGPINTIMFRYAARDVVVPGTDVTVRKGEAVVICVAATGRDTQSFGPDADVFDPSRSVLARHLAFGHGVHYCMGAPLARMMATTALGAFLDHFDLDRTGAPESLPISSYSPNSDAALWGQLKPRAAAPAAV